MEKKRNTLFINREISWLRFNERVLQEAKNNSVPLIERFRFLGIYSNNMDEFFRVRVANLRRLQKAKLDQSLSVNSLLKEIKRIVLQLQHDFELCYSELLHELKLNGIEQKSEVNLLKAQQLELSNFYHNSLKHDIVPIILKNTNFKPKLRDKSIYLAVQLKKNNNIFYSLIEIPSFYPRFYHFKQQNKKDYFILIDDIIRTQLFDIYSLFEPDEITAHTFKFTRDAELTIDDDISISFIDKIEKSLKNRKKGNPVRFVYDKSMPENLRNFLMRLLGIKDENNAIPGGRYHNFKDFSKFPDFGKKELVFSKHIPQKNKYLEEHKRLLKTIEKQDVLLHFPYQQFDYVVDLVREAAIDPTVVSIKLNIYRVAYNSRIMNALMNAVSNGKEVTVFFELQARFDEENNIYWAEKLLEHGAKVIYGYKNLKVHSKLLQIKRIIKKQTHYTSYIGTGNFHEQTAKVYTDIALLTSKKSISIEVSAVFKLLENRISTFEFKQLFVSPFTHRKKILLLIKKEITNAKLKKPAYIKIKVNNLVDQEIIQALYEASNAGVQIQLIVRGVCCLVPGIKNQSENISIISIVGRFLEHARFFIFCNNNKPLYYLGSADLMERNLDKRIEVATPIIDEKIQEEIQFIFDTQWKDNQKARIIDKKQRNVYVNEGAYKINSQEKFTKFYSV